MDLIYFVLFWDSNVNDFTKNELEEINKSIIIDMRYNPCTDFKDKLREKILHMIDNYPDECVHKWLNMAYSYYQCEKCFRRKGMYE